MRQRPPRAGRHPARRVALQTLFEIDFNRADPKETWERGAFRTGLTENAAAFAWQLVEGVLQHRRELDEEISVLAPEFPLSQMAAIDRNVLRIALYELRVLGDAPAAAIIDEAVELAKLFGSEVAPKFVNGVLATAVGGRKERETEP
ncbi:MAG: transcription antitermination factor NusB [Chloroflexi bacterium]|nr:MAG: transcription antitermination factor NusB [Chloroflexota bacterium]TMC54559.1 MAG: transcription antitermination factor NusB [Chloroflexota bacterium]